MAKRRRGPNRRKGDRFPGWLDKTRRQHTATPPGGTAKSYNINQRFVYDQAEGLVRLVEKNGATVLRQSAIPDALSAVAEFAEERAGPFMIEGARAADGFQFSREDAEAACEFLVHLGLLERTLDGGYAPHGEAIADKALAAMNGLPAT